MNQPATNTPQATRTWPWNLLGLLLFAAGPLIYVFQFQAHQLWTPWYVPILATLGALCVVLAWQRRRSVFQIAIAMIFSLLALSEWYMVCIETATPAYTGPATMGRPSPEFEAVSSDGTRFTHRDLAVGSRTLLVFFRGRW